MIRVGTRRSQGTVSVIALFRGRGAGSLCLAAGLIALLLATGPAFGLGVGTASLPGGPPYSRIHPDTTFTFTSFAHSPARDLSIYTGPSIAADGWTMIAAMDKPYFGDNPVTGNYIQGTYRSEVWRNNTTNYLLFAYHLRAAGNVPIATGTIAGYQYDAGSPADSVNIVDAGILHLNGPATFLDDDPLRIQRNTPSGSSNPALALFFVQNPYTLTQGYGLRPGYPADFYFQTESTSYSLSVATLQDSGISAGDIPVFVPGGFGQAVPEPLSMLGVALGLGGLAGYVRRRKRMTRR